MTVEALRPPLVVVGSTRETWISTAEAAEYLGCDPRHARRLAERGDFGPIRRAAVGRNRNGILVAAERLPVEARERYDAASPTPSCYSFDEAGARQRRTATAKTVVVKAYQLFLRQNAGRRGLKTHLTEAWIDNYVETHEEIKQILGRFSIDSLQRWSARFETFGKDGLVDGNDGHGRRNRSSAIQRRVLDFFLSTIRGGNLNIDDATQLARDWASVKGIAVTASNRTFRRAAMRMISPAEWAILRDPDHADTRVYATVRRDYNFPALEIVQVDHHQADIWVACDGTLCGAATCQKAHRPWCTVWIDVASRAVLAARYSLTYPNAETITSSFVDLVNMWGLPNGVYADNGKDVKSALAGAVRRGEALPINAAFVNSVLAAVNVYVIFALKYRGRSKVIERLFRTWVEKLWKTSPAYVGATGKRTKRAQALQLQPSHPDVPTFAEFCERMAIEVDRYNLRSGHRGQGMNGRAPLEVVAETRIPLRRPDPVGWALASWTWYARQVHAGGTLHVGPDRYRLDPRVAIDLLGKNVQLLVDPADVRRAIVVSACAHMNAKVSRAKAMLCGCAGTGVFLCDAALWGDSTYNTYNTEHAITQQNQRDAAAITREMKDEIRSHRNESARADYAAFRRNPLALYRRVRDRALAEKREIVARAAGAGTSATTVLLPQSSIARRAESYRDEIRRGGMTDEEVRLAEAVEPAPFSLRAVPAALDDDQIRRDRERRGLCSFTLDCPNPGAPFCAVHAAQDDHAD